jgi:hypothetical protein
MCVYVSSTDNITNPFWKISLPAVDTKKSVYRSYFAVTKRTVGPSLRDYYSALTQACLSGEFGTRN